MNPSFLPSSFRFWLTCLVGGLLLGQPLYGQSTLRRLLDLRNARQQVAAEAQDIPAEAADQVQSPPANFRAGVALGVERGLSGGMSGPTLRLDLPFYTLFDGALAGRAGIYAAASLDLTPATRQDIDSSRVFYAELIPVTYIVREGENSTDFLRWSAGVLYEQSLGERLTLSANLGFCQESTTSLLGFVYDLSLRQNFWDLGARVGLSLHRNVQLQGGLNARFAMGAPAIVWDDPLSTTDNTASFSIIGAGYSDMFPGRGRAVSAFAGINFVIRSE